MIGNPLFHKRIAKYVRLATLAFAASATLGHGIANAGVVRPLPASGVNLATLREAVSVVPISHTIELPATPLPDGQATLDGQWVASLLNGVLPDMAQPLAWQKLMGSAAPQLPASPQQRTQVVQSLWRAPLHFEPNHGQNPFAVKFAARTPGYQLYALQDQVVLALRGSEALLRMELVGAEVNAQPLLSAEEQLQGRSNYYIGNDPSRWQTDVPNFGKLRYSKVYPGVDWVLYGNARQLEHDFVVAPGTDPSVIALRLHGADAVRLAADGQLVATVGGRELLHSAPVIYQNVNGERRLIDGRYVFKDEDANAPVVGFKVAAYDQSLPLIIDPLVYFTFVGGAPNDGTLVGGDDYGYGIAVDGIGGSAYITGSTSTDNAEILAVVKRFPITGPGHPAIFGAIFMGGTDAFVTRLDAAGAIIYSTYLGGSAFDAAYAIALDPANNVYITGITDSNDFAGPTNSLSGSQDAFITKINSNGALGYSRYIGGSGVDVGLGIAVNTAGNAFVTGYTTSSNFPLPPPPATITADGEDAFVVKVNGDGTGLDYSVLTKWSGNDRGQGIVLDADDNAYITGYRNSPNTTGKGEAVFVAKVDSKGAITQQTTLLDGPKDERGLAIARDDVAGDIYITGYTYSATDIATSNAYDTVINNSNSRDAFIARYKDSGAGFTLNYASYLGGNADDIGYGIAVDGFENAYVTGQTFSPDFPMVNPDDSTMVKGEAFLSRFTFDPPGTIPLADLTYSGFWGGAENDVARGLALDAYGDAYMVGYTNSPKGGFSFGTITPYRDYSGGADAFVAKFSIPLVSGLDYSLGVTVMNTDSSSGTVTSAPAGINCPNNAGGEDCKEKYATDTLVRLTANPGPNSVFIGWAQDCASFQANRVCTLTMDAAKNVVAYFGSAYSVTVIKAGNGTVTSAPAGIDCGANCSKDYANGTIVTLTAAPAAGSVFAGWSGACTGTSPSCTVTVNAAISATATFELERRSIAVTKIGEGTVTSAPAGINCGATCTATYPINSTVILTATPATGWAFAGWEQNCLGSGTSATCPLTITTDRQVLARFIPISATVSVTGNGTVTSSPSGISCNQSGGSCTANYSEGTRVTFSATPQSGLLFVGWARDCAEAGTAPTCALTMNGPKNVAAYFASAYSVTVIKAGDGNGTVTSVPVGINCGTDCTEDYANGTIVTLTAAPAAGSVFAGWSGACTGTSPSCTVTVNAAISATATFELERRSIAVTKIGEGTVTSAPAGINCGATCTATYPINSTVILTATPAAGSAFVGWEQGCASAGTAATCVVSLDEAKNVLARFAPTSYRATVSVNGGGRITSSPSGINCTQVGGASCTTTYSAGTKVTFVSTPDNNSVFVGWGQDCAASGAALTCTMTMDAAKNVVAYFEPTFKVEVTKAGDGNGTVRSDPAGIDCGTGCSGTYNNNTPIALTAVPAFGSSFTGWGGVCATETSTTCRLVVDAAKSVTANFKAQKHLLTVTKDGAGTGKVSSEPAGIDCGNTCSASYGQGAYITLAATPDSSSRFVSWSGGCTGTSNPCSVTMDSARNVNASFERIQTGPLPNISIESLITPNTGGVNVGRSVSFALQVKNAATDANETRSFIAKLYLSADPIINPVQDIDTEYQCNFIGGIAAGKTNNCSGEFLLPPGLSNGASYYLGAYIDKAQLTANNVTNNGKIAANTLPVILLTMNKGGSGSGTVTSTPIGISCAANCPTASMAFMASGGAARAILMASAAPDSTFTGWSGAGCSGTGNCEVTMNGAAQTVTATFTRGNGQPPAPPALSMILSGDYNGDKRADIIWHQAASGAAYGMLLNGFQITEQGYFYNEPNTAWRIVNNGDLNASGKDQLIWWNNQNGLVYWMPMDGIKTAPGGTMIYQEPNTAWQIVAVGDLNGDGKDDLIWWNNQSGQVWGMLMNGQNIGPQGQMYQETNTDWRILAARDFTGDGKADLLWRNQTTGQVYLMAMDGLSIVSGAMTYTEPNLAWSIATVGDLNGDGKADLVWWNSQTGDVWAMLMNGATIGPQGLIYQEPNTAWRIVASGDYNGDGKTDLMWRNSSTGQVYQMPMNGLTVNPGRTIYEEANQDWRIVASENAAEKLPSGRTLVSAVSSLGGEPLNPNAPRLEGKPVNEYQQFTGKSLNSGSIPTAP